MKQTLFMIALTLLGTGGSLVKPLCGVLIYYLFAVLRPQYIWAWALPPDVPWSEYVAVPTIAVAALFLLFRSANRDQSTANAYSPRAYGAVHLVTLLFAAWIALSYFTARNQDAAWPWFLEYLKIFLMFFASAVLIRSVNDVWWVMVVAAIALGYIAFEVNLMYLTTRYMGIYFNGYGGLDNNGAGLMLAMGVPLCLFLWMSTDRLWRWGFAALIPFILHAVLLTFSRGAMVALIAASPLFFMRGKHRLQLAIAFLAVVIILPMLAGREVRREFFSTTRYEDDPSAMSRFDTWSAGWRLGLDYPVFGVGVRNSKLYLHEYGGEVLRDRAIHNQYLQTLADSGFPALGLYLLMLGVMVLGLRRVRRWARRRTDEEARCAFALACGVEGSLAVFCVGGVFLSLEVFELPYLLLLLGAQLPLVLNMAAAQSPADQPARVVAAGARPLVGAPPAMRPVTRV